MIDAVYIDLRSRLVVGVLPKPSFRQAFGALEGDLLIPAEEADRILLWWRRRGIEPLVQRKTHPGFYRLSRLLNLARSTAGGHVADGQSRLSFASVIGVKEAAPRHCVAGALPIGVRPASNVTT